MQLEKLFDELPKKGGESEYHLMLCALKTLGIRFTSHYAPGSTDEDFHRKALDKGGFNLSTGAIIGICIGNQMFVFSTGKAHWTTGEDPDDMNEHKGHGPDGAFLYVVDTVKNQVIYHRTGRCHQTSEFDKNITGVKALATQYNFLKMLS